MLETYHLAATGTRTELRRALSDRTRSPSERALLRAVVSQYDGDVDGAIGILRHHMRGVAGGERAAFADMLAPILVMRHDNAGVAALADVIEVCGWSASARAFRALAAVDMGVRDTARKELEAATQALAAEPDQVIRFRVLQRLARVLFFLDEHERSIDAALASARIADKLGAWRAAAAAYSIAYNVHHNVTGDVAESDRYAALCLDAAMKSEDASFTQGALVAQYDLAVQVADDARVSELEGLIKARLLPQQYTERFALGMANALMTGAENLAAMRTLLQVLRKVPGRSRGEWAMCTALSAVAEAAQAQDEDARETVRSAISHLGRPSRAPAYELRFRRLARAAAAVACMLIRDDVRAARIVQTVECRSGDGEDQLAALVRSGQMDRVPRGLRGIARVFAHAFEMRRCVEPPAGLTKAQVDVLRLYDRGWSAKRIAEETGRSINTVYNHTRSILVKLEASRALEAVAKARERKLLD